VRIVGVFGIVRSVRYLRSMSMLQHPARMQRHCDYFEGRFISRGECLLTDVSKQTIWRMLGDMASVMCATRLPDARRAERSRFTSTRVWNYLRAQCNLTNVPESSAACPDGQAGT